MSRSSCCSTSQPSASIRNRGPICSRKFAGSIRPARRFCISVITLKKSKRSRRAFGIIDHGHLIACDTLPNLLQRLEGLIQFRVSAITPELRSELSALPDTRSSESPGNQIALHCRDVKSTLPRLIAALSQTRTELLSIETIEPNLERVFLHLTGSTLRD